MMTFNSVIMTPDVSMMTENCRVCDEPHATYHYGSICCSGCKGFFRRSVRYNKVYTCSNQNNCIINGEYRNCCRACRFKKCLERGLNPMLVHGDRGVTAHKHHSIMKAVKQERLSESSPESAYSLVPIKKEVVEIDPKFVEKIIYEAKFLHQDKTAPLGAFRMVPQKDMTSSKSIAEYYVMVEKICDSFTDIDLPHVTYEFDNYCSINVPQNVGIREPKMISRRSKLDWAPRYYLSSKFFYQVWCRIMVSYIDWASYIPELFRLSEKDYEILILGRCVPSVFLLFGQRSAIYGTPGLSLSGGSYFPADHSEWSQLDKEMVMICGQLTDTLMSEYINPLKEIRMTEAEYALLRVISFFMTEAKLSVEGMNFVKSVRNKYLDAYAELIRNSHPELTTIDIMKRMSKTMLILAAIEKTAQASDETIAMMTLFNMAGMRGTFTYDFYVRRKDPFIAQSSHYTLNNMSLL